MVIIWSFSFIIVDIAVEFVPPISLALYRLIITSCMFLIIDIYLRIKKKKNISSKDNENNKTKFLRSDWLLIILSSFMGISIFFYAQYSAIEIIGPSLPALFVCLITPVIITILTLIFFNERINRFQIVGFIIATIGGFLLVTGGDIATLTPKSPNFLGYLFALMTPIFWAIFSIATKKLSQSHSSNSINKYIAYIATFELVIFTLINNEFQVFINNFLNIQLFICALYLGILCYIVGYYIWQNSQKKLQSSNVASFLY
ncbi:MAG: DMT family transporter, partial [Candidatus Odinarchaeota archaeon]